MRWVGLRWKKFKKSKSRKVKKSKSQLFEFRGHVFEFRNHFSTFRLFDFSTFRVFGNFSTFRVLWSLFDFSTFRVSGYFSTFRVVTDGETFFRIYLQICDPCARFTELSYDIINLSDRNSRGDWLLKLSNLLLVEQQNGLVITAEDFDWAIQKRRDSLE